MAINTPERRRSAIDFGKIRGTGMPIPSGGSSAVIRAHILNLYSGITPFAVSFFGWRPRVTVASFWRPKVEVPD